MTTIQLAKGADYLIKRAKRERDYATWIDRGLIGGLSNGAGNVMDGNILKGLTQMAGSPLGLLKGEMNVLQTATEDGSRAISQLATGNLRNAALNGGKMLVNGSIGHITGPLFGHALMSKRQAERYKNPELDKL